MEVICEVPKEIKGDRKTESLVTSGGEYPVDCVFILREARFQASMFRVLKPMAVPSG